MQIVDPSSKNDHVLTRSPIQSLKTRWSRRQNNLDLARRYSHQALIWNAAATLRAPTASFRTVYETGCVTADGRSCSWEEPQAWKMTSYHPIKSSVLNVRCHFHRKNAMGSHAKNHSLEA